MRKGQIPIPAIDRVLSKVSYDYGCWTFNSCRIYSGYGLIGVGSRTDGTRHLEVTHRVVYETLVGPIPDGLDLDHLCRNPAYCNPLHLEPVTPRENRLRGALLPQSKLSHCKYGHEYTLENTRFVSGTRKRICRECVRERERKYSDAARAV